MGCGESKHAVATADTLSQSKRSNSKKTNGSENPTPSIEKSTDDVKTNTNASSEGQEKGANAVVNEGENVNKDSEAAVGKEIENPKADDVKETDHQENGETVKENENKEAEVVAEDIKEEKKELKEESTDESKKEEAGGVSLDSSDQLLPPKKEEGLSENEGKQTAEAEEAVQTSETEEVKAPGAKEENATESSAQDPKTT